MRLRNRLIVFLTLGATVVVVAGGVIWQLRHRAFEEKKAAFVAKYESAMEFVIQGYFFGFEELPASSGEVCVPGGELRRPWVFNGIIDSHLNHPTMEEGWLAFEKHMFERVIPVCQKQVPKWEKELIVARQPWVERDGDLPAQLDLFLDEKVDSFAGHFVLTKLQEEQNVTEETLIKFTEAFDEVHRIRRFRRWAGHVADSPALAEAVHYKASQEVKSALQAFRRAKEAVLQEARAPAPSPQSGGSNRTGNSEVPADASVPQKEAE